MIGLTLKEFQQRAVDFLKENSQHISQNKHHQIIMKSPTGSGKTIILIKFIEEYLADYPDSIFCWFTVGKGDLEVQSKEKMERFSPSLKTAILADVLNGGFELGTSYFINWETITKKDNVALKDSERKNLKQHIADAHRAGRKFIVIIDEEHQNDTAKARDIIDTINADVEIRVSATPLPNSRALFYEINEVDVINEGLITRSMYINKDLQAKQSENIQNETVLLLQKADEIRQQIAKEYINENEFIRPLVLIQFPNLNKPLIEFVENKLAEMGYTYENRLVAKWFSPESSKEKQAAKALGKCNIGEINGENSITHHHAEPVFLLFKQALATGWDCPRAKILVKLRENMSESFEIQTLGRLRRMPKAKHYGKDILDCSYLFTFDEKYKEAARNNGAEECQRVFLKPQFKTVSLKKELRNKDTEYEDLTRIRSNLFEFVKRKFNLTRDFSENKIKLENNGFLFGTELLSHYLQGKMTILKDTDSLEQKLLKIPVNTHEHGIVLRHHIDSLKKYTGLSYENTRKLLSVLFLDGFGDNKYQLAKLSKREFYCFIINNTDKFKNLFDDFSELELKQNSFEYINNENKEDIFRIPEEELYSYNPLEQDARVLECNVYNDYNWRMVSGQNRSTCEKLFEKYCNDNPNVRFFYKNGDNGQSYLSIVYHTNMNKTRLFYPDYIVGTEDGKIWLIETKGGEDTNGNDKNIDKQAARKFDSLRRFSEGNGYKFGFVRDKNTILYINNVAYVSDMNHKNWQPLNI